MMEWRKIGKRKKIWNNRIKENGGENATFDIAVKTAYEDMHADTKMIRERRKMVKQKTVGHKHN
ncbi:MAG: hypothetical protein LUQ38_09285 [Methanotrichaceae archaeon]|nr:hypothetical protein [Methanotrichaceae archaeon]